MSRAEQLAPDGWTPRRGSVVVFASTRDWPAPAGRWYVFEQAPDGWWCRPSGDEAGNWARAHPSQLVQGCLSPGDWRGVPGRFMLPAPQPATGGMVAG